MTTTDLPRLEPLQSMRAGGPGVASYQAGPADGDPLLLGGFPYDPTARRPSWTRRWLEGLDSFTLARIARIEASDAP
jgi:hypothetical protein